MKTKPDAETESKPKTKWHYRALRLRAFLYSPGAVPVGVLGDGLVVHLPPRGECAAVLFRKELARRLVRPVRPVLRADGCRPTSVYLSDAPGGLLAEAIRSFRKQRVRAVCVMLGTGDSAENGFAVGEFEGNLRAIVCALAGAGIPVILHTPPYVYWPEAGWTETPDEYRDRMRAAIDPLIDHQSVFPGDTQALEIFANQFVSLTEDGVHGNERGTQVIAECWADVCLPFFAISPAL